MMGNAAIQWLKGYPVVTRSFSGMADYPEPRSLSNPEKIDILLKEYDTIRAEAIARINSRFAFVGLIIGIIALSRNRDHEISYTFVLIVAWFYLGQLLNLLRTGLQHVEHEINRLAGEELLTWETSRSSRLFGIVHGCVHRLVKRTELRILAGGHSLRLRTIKFLQVFAHAQI
jgi:hypothetical protein